MDNYIKGNIANDSESNIGNYFQLWQWYNYYIHTVIWGETYFISVAQTSSVPQYWHHKKLFYVGKQVTMRTIMWNGGSNKYEGSQLIISKYYYYEPDRRLRTLHFFWIFRFSISCFGIDIFLNNYVRAFRFL